MIAQKLRPLWLLFATMLALQLDAQSDDADKSPHKTGFITVNKVRLHYLDWGGKGETLLFLHGMNGTAHRYDNFAPKFTNQFHVLGLTRRGHGESEMPETGYDTATLVADVQQFLDALKIQRAVLAGHSFAGDELTRFAVAHPDRVIKLIYFDSAFDHSKVPESLRWKPLHGVVPELLPAKEESESPDGRRRWVMRTWGEKSGPMIYSMIEGTYSEKHEYTKIKAPTLAFFATGYCPASPANSKCRGFDREKVIRWAESLPEPQRKSAQELIHAQRKYYEQEIEHFRREIPNGRTIVFTNADHVCFIDREPDVLREMRAFLGAPGGEPIDLTRYYQTPASRFDQIEQYPWRDCPRGTQKLGNVPLEIGGMICLWGASNAKGGLVFPEQLQGIQVSRKFDAFYLYHTSFGHSPEGAPVAQLVFRYADGTAITNEIQYGMHVRHWGWQQGEVAEMNDPKSKMVWSGTNSMSRPNRPRLLRFFITEFPNPKPAVEVKTIDLFSSLQRTASCILAMTTGPAELLLVEP